VQVVFVTADYSNVLAGSHDIEAAARKSITGLHWRFQI
jgi:hypothetical protein